MLCCLLAAGSAAQTPKTVTDHFLAFPYTDLVTNAEGKEFTTKGDIEKFRRSLIKIEDVKNGYLRLEGGWEGWGEFALFKKADGSYLIAKAIVECGPVCMGTLAFYELKDGNWNDVTGSFFQAPDNDEVTAAAKKAKLADTSPNMYYALPRKGTQITMKCSMCRGNGDATLFTYTWRSPKFIRR